MTKHPHFALLAALSILGFAPAASAHDDGSELRVLGSDPDAEQEATEEEEAEEYVDEGDYCGDGEPTPLMDAEVLLGDGDYRGLYHEVGTLLRQGRAGWQRPTALSYLATAQLRMGRHRAAARNFALAFRLDADLVSPALRAEQAVALLRSGQRAEALEVARTFVEQECSAPAVWIQAACWSGHEVIARATDDAAVRETEERAAEASRPRTDDLLVEVATFEQLLGEAPTRRIASR